MSALKPEWMRKVDDVDGEVEEMEGKLECLDAFLMGEEFEKLTPTHQDLLKKQKAAMRSYYLILMQRLLEYMKDIAGELESITKGETK